MLHTHRLLPATHTQAHTRTHTHTSSFIAQYTYAHHRASDEGYEWHRTSRHDHRISHHIGQVTVDNRYNLFFYRFLFNTIIQHRSAVWIYLHYLDYNSNNYNLYCLTLQEINICIYIHKKYLCFSFCNQLINYETILLLTFVV